MKNIILGLLVSVISFHGFGTDIKNISVFVTEEQSKNVMGCGNNCLIYEIDATENKLDAYFGELPSNEEDAYNIVMEKINTPEWKAYEQDIIESQKIVIEAFKFGIEKYPAILINDTHVIYGITDVSKATNDFLRNQEHDN